VTIALVTSRGWKQGYADAALKGCATTIDSPVQRVAIATTVLVYAQIVVGATMRHTDAGLAIPDFPLAFGRLVPPAWDAKIAVHFAHRVGAVVVAATVLRTVWLVFARARGRAELTRPAILLLGLVCVQVTLGAFVIWSGKQFVINSVHVAIGAAVLATSLVLALRAHRARFGQVAAVPSQVAA
jgi:cytochrome c oxidase assembly protein subunit 15